MSPDVDAYRDSAAVYVHIPFCSKVCPYCDFAVMAGADDLADRYVAALISEVEMSESWRPLDAVYFGGGTPSHVDPGLLGSILEALAHVHGVVTDAEISLEANPEDFTSDRAEALATVGFNRVSFGAQSFDSDVLVALGRRHGADQIRSAVEAARNAGFENLSLDLMFGTPGETQQAWEATVGSAIEMSPDHVSCYALTVEMGTPLGRSVRDGAPAPDPDTQADFYEFADAELDLSGLRRYEVSNWSKPGFECRYNLTVWAQGEYEAYGNGAHRHRNGIRSRNIRRLSAYLDAIEAGSPPSAGSESLFGWEAELDRLFVGLRRRAGVSPGAGGQALLDAESGQRLVEAGVLGTSQDRLSVLRPLLTDEVNRAVLDLPEPESWT